MNSNKVLGGKTTSVIFLHDPDGLLLGFLPNGKSVQVTEFEKVIFASTNFPVGVCNRLADDIRNGDVTFPFYLNVRKN